MLSEPLATPDQCLDTHAVMIHARMSAARKLTPAELDLWREGVACLTPMELTVCDMTRLNAACLEWLASLR